MQAIHGQTFADRAKGAMTLDRATYRQIGLDQGAMPQAALIVVLAGFGFGFGFPDGNVAFGIATAVAAIIGWLAFAGLT